MAARNLLALLVAATFTTGCPLVQEDDDGPSIPFVPSAELRSVALTEKPSYTRLGAHFCHDFAAGNPLLGAGCTGFFGRAPALSSLRFGFTTTFALKNDNSFAVPLLEMLLALDVFEGTGQQALGAICVSFCEDPAAGCEQPTDPCVADNQINGVEDFVPDIDDLITIAIGAATGGGVDGLGELGNLGLRYIPANGETETAVRFDLDIDAMLGLIGELVEQSSDELLTGQEPSFDIPFKAQGSLFFQLPVLGRNALAYGPFDGSWSLD